MNQKEEEFQFFKSNKKADKSTAYTLLVPLLAFIVNLFLTFSIVSYFSHPQPLSGDIQIQIVNLNNQQDNPIYGINYEQVYQKIKESQQSSNQKFNSSQSFQNGIEPSIKPSISDITNELSHSQNIYNQTLTPEEIKQINQYFKP